jgi:hypothetical protein
MLQSLNGQKFGTMLVDPPWRFSNRTGKMARSISAWRGTKP